MVFVEQPDGFDDVEVTHPAPLEGESGNSGKQTLGDSGNSVASNSDHSPEKETHHTSITPSKIPVPRERSNRILAQPLVNYWLLNNPNFRGPKEWQHHVPAVEEAGYVTIDYAMIGATLEDDPLSVKEAKDRPDWPKWKEAMDTEITQLTKHSTFKLIDLPSDRKAIASKWVYRIKRNHIRTITKHKARLMAKGCSQIPGIDFVETFTSVM